MQVAVIFINPVLVSVLRTFEIVMALILEICVSSYMFDFGNVSFAYKVAGSAAVTLSAIIMAVSDKIGELLPGPRLFICFNFRENNLLLRANW